MFDVKRNYSLEIAVFTCGAVVMMYELVGSRVMAPYVGTSTYAWTSLIGIILASLSAGYYLGGRFADAKPSLVYLGFIIMISALGITLTNVLKDPISVLSAALPVVLEIKTLILSFLLFSPSSFFLGMVAPFAVRLRVNDLTKTGSTAGNLYALSTLGSIMGTFLAGFFIIPSLGTTTTLFALSMVLLLISTLLFGKELRRFFVLGFVVVVITFVTLSLSFLENFNADVIDIDTEYSRAWIFEGVDQRTRRPIRALKIDPYAVQAAVFIDGADDLVFDYTKFYHLAGHFVKDINHSLLIGGSVYTYPRDFLTHFPKARMDVVEIDSGMTDIARRYFGLTDSPRLSIFHEDGRMFINRETKKYDVIFIDAFNSASSIPFQLTTIEVARRLQEMLNDDGAILINIISSIEGDKGMFLRAEYATYRRIFPHVFVFPVQHNDDGFVTQNVILLALKSREKPFFESNNPAVDERLKNLWQEPIEEDMPILVDDFAPVDYYRREAL